MIYSAGSIAASRSAVPEAIRASTAAAKRLRFDLNSSDGLAGQYREAVDGRQTNLGDVGHTPGRMGSVWSAHEMPSVRCVQH